MVEFLVGYPRERRGILRRCLTVLADFGVILLVITPTLTSLVEFQHSINGPTYYFLFYAIAITLAFLIVAMMYLVAYYLGLRWSIRAWLRRPFIWLLVVNLVRTRPARHTVLRPGLRY
jgi:hypothetical protein